MTKLAKTHMPGWVSNAPVQINVGRDLHIHGGFGEAQSTATDCPSHDVGTRVVGAFARVATALWWTAKAVFWLGYGLLSLCAWTTFGAYAIAVWFVGRLGDLLRGVERLHGAGPTHLLYVPSVMRRDDMPVLTAGDRVNELQPRNTTYDHAN